MTCQSNCVSRIPTGIAAAVADFAPEFIAAERIVLDYVNAPVEKSPAKLAERRKEFSAGTTRPSLKLRGSSTS